MVDIERGNGEWGILRNWGTSGRPPISQNSTAKFQNSRANSPSVNLSSTNENAWGMGNGKRDLTQSILTTPILVFSLKLCHKRFVLCHQIMTYHVLYARTCAMLYFMLCINKTFYCKTYSALFCENYIVTSISKHNQQFKIIPTHLSFYLYLPWSKLRICEPATTSPLSVNKFLQSIRILFMSDIVRLCIVGVALLTQNAHSF